MSPVSIDPPLSVSPTNPSLSRSASPIGSFTGTNGSSTYRTFTMSAKNPGSGRPAHHEAMSKVSVYLSHTLTHGRLLEIELILLAFSTGILDVMTYADYHVFTSIQTGNTVQLAVGALQIGGVNTNMVNTGVVLGVFVGGGVLLGQLGTWVGPRRRSWLLATNFFQTLLVGIAAALRWKVATESSGPGALGIIALLSFAAGGQLALARTVNVPDITTVMITAAYIDFFIDPALFQWNNSARTRRLLSICALFGGAFVGSTIYKFAGGAAALGLSALCKLATTAIFLVNKRIEAPVQDGHVSLGDLEEGDVEREHDDVGAVGAAASAGNRDAV